LSDATDSVPEVITADAVQERIDELEREIHAQEAIGV